MKKLIESKEHLLEARAKGVFSVDDNYLNSEMELLDMPEDGAGSFVATLDDKPFSYANNKEGFALFAMRANMPDFRHPLNDEAKSIVADHGSRLEAYTISLEQQVLEGKLEQDVKDQLLNDFTQKL